MIENRFRPRPIVGIAWANQAKHKSPTSNNKISKLNYFSLLMKKIFHSLLSAAILATVVFYLPACTGAQHGKESVEEVASYTQADYFTTDSEKQIINASNQFSLRLFKELAASNKGKDLFFSPLGVVSTLEILSNGTDGQTLKQLQQTLGTSRFQLDDINALNRKMMIAHAKVEEDQFTGTKSAYMKSSHLFLYQKKHIINPDFIQTITHSYFADSHAFDTPENAQQIVDSCCK